MTNEEQAVIDAARAILKTAICPWCESNTRDCAKGKTRSFGMACKIGALRIAFRDYDRAQGADND